MRIDDTHTLDICASSTNFTIWDNALSQPTCVACTNITPVWFTDPPMTVQPTDLVTGFDSPVIKDSLTHEVPDNTIPSQGILDPAFT